MKKSIYSAKPGNLINGKPIEVYIGKPKTRIRNRENYLDRTFSDRRRAEIKKEAAERTTIRKVVGYFKEQSQVENCRKYEKLLNDKIKNLIDKT